MHTHHPARPVLALLALLFSGPPAAADVSPCPGGRFALQGAVLPADASGIGPRTVEVSDADAPSVQLDGCGAVEGVRRARARGTTVRARVTTCAATGPFRVRLDILPTCDALIGTTRAHGQVAARFVGTLAVQDDPGAAAPDPGTSDGGNGGSPAPPVDPTLPDTAPPLVTGFAPASARPGDVVSILGEHFDRDAHGIPYTGRPPYEAAFKSRRTGPAVEPADVTFMSTTELRVTIPPDALSGAVQLNATTPGVPGGVVFATSGVPFTVLDDTGAPLPAHPALLVRNDSQYNLVSLLVNGQEAIFARGLVRRPGDALEVTLTATGQVQLTAAIGFSTDERLFTFETTAVVGNEVAVVPVAAVSIERLLTGSQPSRLWSADPGNRRTIRFLADGTWQLEDNGRRENGTVALLEWPNEARHVRFQLLPSGEQISIAYEPDHVAFSAAFDVFVFRNAIYRPR